MMGQIYFQEFMYILSISSQLSAAILLVRNINTKREVVVRDALSKNGKRIVVDKDGNLLDVELVRTEAEEAIINRRAFMLLFIGYLAGIFGKQVDEWMLWTLFGVMVLTSVLFVGISEMSRKESKGDKYTKVNFNEIPLPKDVMVVEVEGESRDI